MRSNEIDNNDTKTRHHKINKQNEGHQKERSSRRDVRRAVFDWRPYRRRAVFDWRPYRRRAVFDCWQHRRRAVFDWRPYRRRTL